MFSSLPHDPLPCDLNREQAALQRLQYRMGPCGSVGQSWRVAAVPPVPNNGVVAKKPLPFEPLNRLRENTFSTTG